MDIEAIRKYCLQFPHTTETVQWGADLCFKVDGKLFVVAAMEMVPQRISFKCTPENFAELCERPGIIPAPYMARAQWVSLERLNALSDSELREMIAESYRLVWERLPKKRRLELETGATLRRTKSGKPKSASRKSAAKAKSSVKKKSAKAARRG
ncbi:MAG: MmcQ/YjbR family DNA-binding protein [Candidatus Korobacteraceae bacterium]